MFDHLDRDFVTRRINVITGFVIALFLIYVIGFWYLQIIKGSYYEALAGENVFKEYPLPAPRGLIVDRKNHILAENRLSHSLFLTPRLSRNLKHTLEFLAGALGTTPEELNRTLKKEGSINSHRPVLIFQDLTLSQLAYISARKIEYPELDLHLEQKRAYPYGNLFSHVIGYVGELTEDQERLKRFPGASRRDIVGQSGLERYYNHYLMGKRGGIRKVVNSYGAEMKEFAPVRQPPVPGKVLSLGLDLDLQKAAEQAFIEKDRAGALVALDVKTGQVLALYNRPNYDPNHFIPRIEPTEWKALLANPQHPLQNRSIQNKFSPGSTFKIVMALAGLQEEKINPETRFHCGGSQYIYNRTFRCWKAGGHGGVNLYKAIMQSCDVYFYNLGMRLDIDVIARYSRLLGLGSDTGIDLPNESSGLVPDRKWKKRVTGDKWYPGETISVAIGQGPVLTTALQMASLTATVARGGVQTKPHIVRSILQWNGKLVTEVESSAHQIREYTPKRWCKLK